jgi:hypothetical protein
MSYDFLMFKATVPVDSAAELSREKCEVQSPEGVMKALSVLVPSLRWTKAITGAFWQAQATDEDGYYDFHVNVAPSPAWSVRTSFGRTTRKLIPTICKALGVVAVDMQAGKLIDQRGERSA